MRRLLFLALIPVVGWMSFPTTDAVAVMFPTKVDSGPTRIVGVVRSEAGAPIVSAQVYLERMNIGAMTNDSGRYAFDVPAVRANGDSATVTARLVGYQQQSHGIRLVRGVVTTVNFVLKAHPISLGQVIAPGYASVEPQKVRGAQVNSMPASAPLAANAYSSPAEDELDRADEVIIVEKDAKAKNEPSSAMATGAPGASSYIRTREVRTW